MSERFGYDLGRDPPIHPDDDLPLFPVIVSWIGRYARAADGEKDAIVGQMLRAWNAMLYRSTLREDLDAR